MDHVSPKTQGGSPTVTLIAAIIGIGLITGVPLLTALWEKRHPPPPWSPDVLPTVSRGAIVQHRRWRVVALGAGLLGIPILTFAGSAIAVGFGSVTAERTIMAGGVGLTALDGLLFIALVILKILAAITRRSARDPRRSG